MSMATLGGTQLRLLLLIGGLIWSGATGVMGQGPVQQKFPDVLAAKVTVVAADTFNFDITLSSPYDTPQRYADAFRVKTRDGRILGERVLWHDHQNEQPFTRDLHGVSIAPGIAVVVVEGRDKQYGWGGKTLETALPGR